MSLKTTLNTTLKTCLKTPVLAAVVAIAPLATPLSAAAQTLVDATNLDDILSYALDYGDAELDVDSLGDPMISGKIDKTLYSVFFYGCTDNKDCSSIQFMASYVDTGGVDQTLINEWNRDMRFGKAYLDDEGEPVVEMNVNLWSGVHENNLYDTFDWWRVVLEGFEEHIQFEHADDTTPATPAPAVEAEPTPTVREAQTDSAPAATGGPSTVVGMGQGAVSGGSKIKPKN